MFLPCVLVPGAHKTRGGARFFGGGQIQRAECLLPNFSAKRGGGKWASNMLSPVFFSHVGFLGVPFLRLVAAGHAEQTKKKQKKKKKKKKKKK